MFKAKRKRNDVTFARTCAYCSGIGVHKPECDRPAAKTMSALPGLCMGCLGYPGRRIEPCGFCGGNQAADANSPLPSQQGNCK